MPAPESGKGALARFLRWPLLRLLLGGAFSGSSLPEVSEDEAVRPAAVGSEKESVSELVADFDKEEG